MEYHSTIRKDEILPFATTWMDLKAIMLSEVTQTEKFKKHTKTFLVKQIIGTDHKSLEVKLIFFKWQ